MTFNPLLQELIEGASCTLYWSVDAEKFRVIVASDDFYKILGKNKGTLLEILHPADVDYFITAIHLLDKTERHVFQHRFMSPELKSLNYQTEIWKSKNSSDICGASTPLTTTRASIGDDKISSHEFLDLVIENVPHMVFVKEATELRFVHFNRAGEELLGVRREEIVGKNDYDFFPKEQADFFTSKDRLVLSGKKMVDISEEEILTKSGTKTVRTKKIPLIGPDGEAQFILGFSEDITEWKNSENQRLEMVREQIRIKERASSREKTIFLSNAHNILASSLDYHITLEKLAKIMIPFLGDWCTITILNEDGSYNRVASHHKDPIKQMLATEVRKYTPRVTPDSGTFQAVLKEGKSVLTTHVTQEDLLRLSMNEHHLNVLNKLGCKSAMTVPIIYRDRIHGAISVVASDSSRTFTSQDLAMAEELGMRAGVAIENALLYQTAQKAIAVRDEFLSIASHELKTPVTSLKLLLQMTRKGVVPEESIGPSPQKLALSLDKANTQVNRLTNLIEDLLDTSRIQMGKVDYYFQKVNLSELVQDMCDSYRDHLSSHGCEMNTFIEKDIFVRADRMRFEQVVLNILTNAAKYGNQKPVNVTLKNTNGFSKLTIKDHGLGIPKDKQDRVFDRFERAISSKNISGLGLGLFISKEIIKAHNGKIWVDSEPYHGAEFHVELSRLPDNETDAISFS
jgi:PAS domain S-box-containing protein